MHTEKISPSIIILTIISPVLGLYYSIRGLNWHQRKWALIFFVTIFGSILTFNEAADSYRLQLRAYEYASMSFNQFIFILKHIVTLNPLYGYPTDVYIHVVSYFTGAVLGFPALFFTVTSFIFGYFYITALSKILRWDRYTHKPLIFMAVVLLFIIYRGVDTMQSVRTWTGMWILFNGVFGYLQTNQKKYLYLMLASPLIHFAYFAISLPAFFIIFARKLSPKIFIVIYISSFFVSLNQGGILDRLNENELGRSKINSYYREDGDPILDRKEKQNTVWYTKYGKADAVYWGGNAFALTLILGGFFKKRMTKLEAGLFSTGLLMAALANFGDFVYIFYSRTMANAVLYILATVVLLVIRGELLQGSGLKLLVTKAMLWVSILIFIPKIVYTLSNTLIYTSFYILASPFLGWFSEVNVSIREVIGWLL